MEIDAEVNAEVKSKRRRNEHTSNAPTTEHYREAVRQSTRGAKVPQVEQFKTIASSYECSQVYAEAYL